MSGLIKIEIETALDKCKSILEIEEIRQKYNNGFTNEDDIKEFNHLIANARTRVLVEISLR